ncbi:ABC transporter substrate-binding protein [Streptomyces sp. NPDC008343]|uniref:ABC transporter substrate-binding protein n=1 Tax=Streptomyces sp. NPDC008343 TaxID=3364828 RepID=UPI0036E88492
MLGVVAGAVVASAGCSAGGSKGTAAADTVTIAIKEDPGSLDPHHSTRSAALELARFAYDTLVHVDSEGKTVSGLAASWKQSGSTYTFTLKDGASCADGTPVNAKVVADNLAYASDPKNESPLLGLAVPAKMKVTSEVKAGTVTIKADNPGAFFLEGLATVPIVCEAGLGNRRHLTTKTVGSGPYELTAAVPNDRYTYTLRDDYAWGPDGASAKASSMPKTVVFRVVENETTTANMLLSNDVQIGAVAGSDRKRMEGNDFFRRDVRNIAGEIFFNEASSRPTSDERVRRALAMALNLGEVGKVLTSGFDTKATGMITLEPRVCTADTVTGNLPKHDPAAAESLLDRAGWKAGPSGIREKGGKKLSLDLLFGTSEATRATAAELAIEQWKAIGVEVKPVGKTDAEVNTTLFNTGAWDMTWNTLQAQLPSQLVPFLSGATPGDGGTNFAHIDNRAYEGAAAKAAALPGPAGCDEWKKAETALIERVDVVPYIGKTYPVWGRGVSFESTAFGITPTSLQGRNG